MSDNIAFSFSGTNRTYGNGTRALSDFSFSARKGERVSLLGPSGCGKTSVLRLLSGLDSADNPESFRMRLNEADRIGYVFQDSNLLPWANVSDNVYTPLRLRPLKDTSGANSGGVKAGGAKAARAAARTAIEESLERVGLGDCANLWPHELSGGMKMRVSIARALIARPCILLLDEPFAALDEITRFRLNDLLLGLHEKDRFTLVLVTHSTFESAYLSERVALMSRTGRVAKEISLPSSGAPIDRASRSYGENCALLSAALREVMAESQSLAESKDPQNRNSRQDG